MFGEMLVYVAVLFGRKGFIFCGCGVSAFFLIWMFWRYCRVPIADPWPLLDPKGSFLVKDSRARFDYSLKLVLF